MPPRRSGPSMPSTSPCTWNSGSACASRSSAVHAHAAASASRLAATALPGQHRALRRAGGAGGVDRPAPGRLRAARAGTRPSPSGPGRRRSVDARQRRPAARRRARRAPAPGAASASTCASSRSPSLRVDRHRRARPPAARRPRRPRCAIVGVACTATRAHPAIRRHERARGRGQLAVAQLDGVGPAGRSAARPGRAGRRAGSSTAHPTTLPGLRMPVRIQGLLDRPLQRQHRRPELALHAGPLEQPDAVLAGDRAAQVDRGGDDVVERGLGARSWPSSSPCGVSISGCRLPSPACAMVAIGMSCAAADLLDPARASRRACPRGRQTSSVSMACRAAPAPGTPAGGRRTAPRPPPGRWTASPRVAPAATNSAWMAAASCSAAGSGRSVWASSSAAASSGRPGVLPLVDRAQAVPVDQLERRRAAARARSRRRRRRRPRPGCRRTRRRCAAAAVRSGRSRTVTSVITAERALRADHAARPGRSRPRPSRCAARPAPPRRPR